MLALAANAMHLDTKAPEEPSRVVIMPNLQEETNSLRSSILSLMEASSMFFSLYGSAGLSPVFVFEKDILAFVNVLLWGLFLLLFATEGVVVSRRTVLM
jgi:hypothetical protein